uniref:Hemicentin-2 n=1 Tax=Aceria tosichella TaxID=561515 RepID=A0A6G1SEB4_9ACAR
MIANISQQSSAKQTRRRPTRRRLDYTSAAAIGDPQQQHETLPIANLNASQRRHLTSERNLQEFLGRVGGFHQDNNMSSPSSPSREGCRCSSIHCHYKGGAQHEHKTYHQTHSSSNDSPLSTTRSTRTFIKNCQMSSAFTKMLAMRPSNKMILTTTLSLIVIILTAATSVANCQDQFVANVGLAQLESQQQTQLIGGAGLGAAVSQYNQLHQHQHQHQPSGGLNEQQATSVQRQKQYEISIEPNKPARLECKLPQLNGAEANNGTQQNFYWNFQRSSAHNRRPDLLCWGTHCQEAKRRGIELDFDQASGNYNLLIRNATYKEHDGIYYCDYRDSSPDASQSTEIQLTILIPPQPPTITATSQSSPKEGQEYQLNCHSYGGNPEPNITWFKGDQVILAGAGVRLEQSRQNGTTTSTLTWIPTIDDHNATYRCSVSNRAMSSPTSYEREITLQVEFAPRIIVGPYNPLKVIQGDRATLSCQVDAHPPVKGIRWYKEGQLISNQYNHTILDVKIQDAGWYSCQADNGIAPVMVLSGGASNPLITAAGQSSSASSSSLFSYLGFGGSSPSSSGHSGDLTSAKTLVEARLFLEVQYAPRVQIRESRAQPLREGDQFTLNCSVDSSPPAHEFVWSKQEDGGQTVRRLSVSSSPSLEFQSVSASDMGNYTCTAYNRLEPSGQQQQVYERHSSASIMVLVRHKPGLAEIIVGQNGETELGNTTHIQCRANPPGYPEPKCSFWKYRSPSGMDKKTLQATKSSIQDYTIFSASSEDEGRYSCKLWNELGDSNEALGDLIVNEAPSIVPSKTWLGVDTQQPGAFPYSIMVQASGKPEPKVTWFHRSPVDGRRIDLSSPLMQSKFRIETQSKPEPLSRHQQQALAAAGGSNAANSARHRYIVVSTLVFKQPLDIDDRGLYTVEFSNGLSRTAIESHQLHIYHSPIPALKNTPIISNRQQQQQQAQSNVLRVKTRAGFDLGETVNLTCRVSAYPRPVFLWTAQAGSDPDKAPLLDNNSRFKQIVENPQDDIFESTLTFQLASQSDYGDYMCATANADSISSIVGDRDLQIIISLGQKTLPDPPSQVEQIDASQDSVTLQWVPGFDGGYPTNYFMVQYAPEGAVPGGLSRRYGPLMDEDGQSSLMMADQSASMSQGPADTQYPKLFDCQTMNPCTIGNLQPRQTYLMRVRAKNDHGFSEFGQDIRAYTQANQSAQIPRIQEAHYDMSNNILHYRVEPNSEYLLNNLNIHIEVKSPVVGSLATTTNQLDQSTSYTTSPQQQQQQSVPMSHEFAPAAASSTGQTEWRLHLPPVRLQSEGSVYLNMSRDIEQLRLTVCSLRNESLCGPEFLVGTQSATSSFLQDQRGLSMSIFVIILFLLVVITVMATTLHTKCLSRKAKKAAALGRPEHTTSGGHHNHHHLNANGHNQTAANGVADNKPSLTGHINGGLNLANGATKVGSHGSTTSTNSTSATNGVGGPHGQLQSIDSINQTAGQHLNGGSASDHSSDHSRQAKLDSMLPPNYSHYADRASLMLEQQQQQQQQPQQQPQENQVITVQNGQTAAVSNSAQGPVSVPSSLSSSSAAGSAASSASGSAASSASGSVPTNTNAIIVSSSNDEKPKQAQEWPMVTVDGQANKSTVDVHVPVFFDMVNHADREQGKSKLDLSVLQGLVTVNKDKTRDANGDMTGPVKVTVFGIPVYSGKGTSSYFASSSSPTSSSSSGASGAAAAASAGNSSPQASQENTIETRRGGLASRAEDTASMLTNKVQKVNDKMINSLSDIFERFSTALRRTGSSLASSGVDSAGQLKIEQERANVARIQS